MMERQSAAALAEHCAQHCRNVLRWVEAEIGHRQQRDDALTGPKFSFSNFHTDAGTEIFYLNGGICSGIEVSRCSDDDRAQYVHSASGRAHISVRG
jgi:hypothetical protein